MWVGGAGLTVAVGLVALMAMVVGTPGWWLSLLLTSAVAAVAVVGMLRARTLPESSGAVVVAVLVAAAAGGLAGVAVHERSDARSVIAAREEVARVGAPTVCRVIERGTPARQAAALAAATGDLAARLRSGAAVLGASDGQAACRPLQTGVTAVSPGAAEVVALVEVSADGATGQRVVTAGLRRVDGRWAVAAMQVVR
jgi:energy-coupling factor transporter transmembrane protein EcfT